MTSTACCDFDDSRRDMRRRHQRRIGAHQTIRGRDERWSIQVIRCGTRSERGSRSQWSAGFALLTLGSGVRGRNRRFAGVRHSHTCARSPFIYRARPDVRDVGERIAFENEHVGPLPRLDRSGVSNDLSRAGDGRRGEECVHWRGTQPARTAPARGAGSVPGCRSRCRRRSTPAAQRAVMTRAVRGISGGRSPSPLRCARRRRRRRSPRCGAERRLDADGVSGARPSSSSQEIVGSTTCGAAPASQICRRTVSDCGSPRMGRCATSPCRSPRTARALSVAARGR